MAIAYRSMFQFHYGSIKMLGSSLAPNNINLFQFHYGSIKMIRKELNFITILRFNSTMVRLKL